MTKKYLPYTLAFGVTLMASSSFATPGPEGAAELFAEANRANAANLATFHTMAETLAKTDATLVEHALANMRAAFSGDHTAEKVVNFQAELEEADVKIDAAAATATAERQARKALLDAKIEKFSKATRP